MPGKEKSKNKGKSEPTQKDLDGVQARADAYVKGLEAAAGSSARAAMHAKEHKQAAKTSNTGINYQLKRNSWAASRADHREREKNAAALATVQDRADAWYQANKPESEAAVGLLMLGDKKGGKKSKRKKSKRKKSRRKKSRRKKSRRKKSKRRRRRSRKK